MKLTREIKVRFSGMCETKQCTIVTGTIVERSRYGVTCLGARTNNFRVTDSTYWTGYFNRIYNYFHYHCIISVYPCLMNKYIHTYMHTV